MIDDIKSMFTEKTIPTIIVMAVGVVVGVVIGVFTPVKKLFSKKGW